MKRYLLFVLLCLYIVPTGAKDIKLAKNIYFRSSLEELHSNANNLPTGKGDLLVKVKRGSSFSVLKVVLSGDFNGNIVENATIHGQNDANIKVDKVKYEISNDKDPQLKITSVNNYSGVIAQQYQPFTLIYGKKEKEFLLTYYTKNIFAITKQNVNTYQVNTYSGDESWGMIAPKLVGSIYFMFFDHDVLVKKNNYLDKNFVTTRKSSNYSYNGDIHALFIRTTDGVIWKGKQQRERRASIVNIVEFDSEISFANGNKYIGTVTLDEINTIDEYGRNLLTKDIHSNDIHFLNGVLTTKDGEEIVYKSGKEYHSFIKKNATAKYVHHIDIKKEIIVHRNYNGDIIESSFEKIGYLLSNNIVDYYKIPNVKTEVQQKLFKESNEYKSTYLPRFQKELSYLLEDEYWVNFDGTYLDDYDLGQHRFKYETGSNLTYAIERYKLYQQKGQFHILIPFLEMPNLYLTYPKSLVEITNHLGDDEWQIQNIYTCVVPEVDAAQMQPNIDYFNIWCFKLEYVNDKGVYGKSTQRYIINKNTNEVILNLNETFRQSNERFIKVDVKRHPKEKPKKYHDKGRMENCWQCWGRGYVTGGYPVNRNTCDVCAGKGWYIEHYW